METVKNGIRQQGREILKKEADLPKTLLKNWHFAVFV